MKHTTWLPLLVLAAILFGGSYVRLADLTDHDFRGDELRHYFVARSLEQGSGPLLPSGHAYRRGIDVSRAIAVLDSRIEEPALAARLPGAVFGVLNIAIFALVAWLIAGPWPAVVAAALLAIDPEALHQSRHVRFYTYQLNFGLVALLACWKSVDGVLYGDRFDHRSVRRHWAWMLLAALAFALAFRVQVVSATVIAGFGICLSLAAIIYAFRHGRAAWRDNTPLHAVVIGALFAAVVLILRPGLVPGMVAAAFAVPAWTEPGSPLTYYWALSSAFPLIVSLSPVIFIAAALRRLDLAAFLLIWFAVPFLLLSLVFPFKGQRFLMLAVPALFLATGIAAEIAASALAAAVRNRLPPRTNPRLRHGIAAAAVVVVALITLGTTPAFNAARRSATSDATVLDRERWRATAEILRAQPDRDRLLLGSGDEFAPLFYWGRLDFHVTTGGENDSTFISRATGVPRLLTPPDIRSFYPGGGIALVAVDSARLAGGLFDRELIATLRAEAIELCDGRCGALMLYRWEFGPSAMDGDSPAAASTAFPQRPLRETAAGNGVAEPGMRTGRIRDAYSPASRR